MRAAGNSGIGGSQPLKPVRPPLLTQPPVYTAPNPIYQPDQSAFYLTTSYPHPPAPSVYSQSSLPSRPQRSAFDGRTTFFQQASDQTYAQPAPPRTYPQQVGQVPFTQPPPSQAYSPHRSIQGPRSFPPTLPGVRPSPRQVLPTGNSVSRPMLLPVVSI